jgi:hypothetical protein
VKRAFVLLVVVVSATLAARVETAAAATNECRGLMTCVPVAGPWVVVPTTQKTPRPQVQWQLNCPKGYVVGGVDAELTDPAIDVWFLATSGSPVGPGTTTSRTLVFVATYVGNAKPAPTFRPHVGCVPATGGGGRRTPTAVQTIVPPGRPTVHRVRNVRVQTQAASSIACHSDERLVAGYATRAFRGARPPTPAVVASLSARATLGRNRVVVRAHGGDGRGVVQIAAVCAGGR